MAIDDLLKEWTEMINDEEINRVSYLKRPNSGTGFDVKKALDELKKNDASYQKLEKEVLEMIKENL